MRVNIKSSNIKLSESIYVYTEKKIGELEKFIRNVGAAPEKDGEHDPIEVEVDVEKVSQHHRKGDVFKAVINVSVPGEKYMLRAESEQWDLHQAIDEAKDDMARQLKRHKNKRRQKSDRLSRKFKNVARLSRLARKRDEK